MPIWSLWRTYTDASNISGCKRSDMLKSKGEEAASILSKTTCHQMKSSHNIKIQLLHVTLKDKHFHRDGCPFISSLSPDLQVRSPSHVIEWLEEVNREVKLLQMGEKELPSLSNLLCIRESLLCKDQVVINTVKETQCYPLILAKYEEITRNKSELKSILWNNLC